MLSRYYLNALWLLQFLFISLISTETIVDYTQESVLAYNKGFAIMFQDRGYSLDVTSLGDINGDGINDLAMGEPAYGGYTGAVYLIYGRTGEFEDYNLKYSILPEYFEGMLITYSGGQNELGWSISGAGDINMDGIPDMIIGTFTSSGNVGAFVLYGKDRPYSRMDLANISPDDGFKIIHYTQDFKVYCAVSRAGDINNDGADDVLVRMHRVNSKGRFEPSVIYAIYGTSNRTGPVNLDNFTSADGFKITEENPGPVEVKSTNWIGDINHDGIDDFVVGTYGYTRYLDTLYVIYGNAAGFSDRSLTDFTSDQGFKITWEGAYGDYIWDFSVAHAEDLNGDGINDIVLSIDGDSQSALTLTGIVFIIYGKQGGLSDIDLADFDSSQGFRIYGAMSYNFIGISVSSLGDVNNDGYEDLLIGAKDTTATSGKAYIIFGQKGGNQDINLTSSIYTLSFKTTGHEYLGSFGIRAGDLNDDGIDDIVAAGRCTVFGMLGRNCDEYSECAFTMPAICYASRGCECLEVGGTIEGYNCVLNCSSGYYQSGLTCVEVVVTDSGESYTTAILVIVFSAIITIIIVVIIFFFVKKVRKLDEKMNADKKEEGKATAPSSLPTDIPVDIPDVSFVRLDSETPFANANGDERIDTEQADQAGELFGKGKDAPKAKAKEEGKDENASLDDSENYGKNFEEFNVINSVRKAKSESKIQSDSDGEHTPNFEEFAVINQIRKAKSESKIESDSGGDHTPNFDELNVINQVRQTKTRSMSGSENKSESEGDHIPNFDELNVINQVRQTKTRSMSGSENKSESEGDQIELPNFEENVVNEVRKTGKKSI